MVVQLFEENLGKTETQVWPIVLSKWDFAQFISDQIHVFRLCTCHFTLQFFRITERSSRCKLGTNLVQFRAEKQPFCSCSITSTAVPCPTPIFCSAVCQKFSSNQVDKSKIQAVQIWIWKNCSDWGQKPANDSIELTFCVFCSKMCPNAIWYQVFE